MKGTEQNIMKEGYINLKFTPFKPIKHSAITFGIIYNAHKF